MEIRLVKGVSSSPPTKAPEVFEGSTTKLVTKTAIATGRTKATKYPKTSASDENQSHNPIIQLANTASE